MIGTHEDRALLDLRARENIVRKHERLVRIEIIEQRLEAFFREVELGPEDKLPTSDRRALVDWLHGFTAPLTAELKELKRLAA